MKLMISSVAVMVASLVSVGVAAQPGEMERRGGWMDGGTGGGDVIWIVIGVLVVVLLVVVITKVVGKNS